jgi:hypothetical protein
MRTGRVWYALLDLSFPRVFQLGRWFNAMVMTLDNFRM